MNNNDSVNLNLFSVFFYSDTNCKKWRGVPVAQVATWNTEKDFFNYLSVMNGEFPLGGLTKELFKEYGSIEIRIGTELMTYTVNARSIITESDYEQKLIEANVTAINTANYLQSRYLHHRI